ncbi:hypothetical protein QYE76_031285 [Lolium multiflorum]|uniref:Transposase (putative) gypsy type domain-containing protein n=1 Tax=Lolium multiflorum TaxID=4521 RepID=A0AAD8QRV3_LOLMU|nr:hypothetical protein QYE76_031285 [Lolium multiflorum]
MGKKKGASASEAAKVSRDWSASAISNRDINKLRSLGFISASEDDIRLPGAVSRPKPPKGFTVMFSAFLFRGLSLPAHEFLRSLLYFYGIQLWQLTPNSILHLSIFVAVCEAFLGIDPHWGLWKKIFYVKRHNDSNGPPVVGGVGFVVRKEVDYLDYPMKESVQGWRNKWFYLRDPSISGRCSNLPPFEDKLIAKPKKSWQNTLSPDEKLTADRLFDQVVTLKNTGGLTMCGTEVVSVFLQRRVQPLMSRPHQLWLYSGRASAVPVTSAAFVLDSPTPPGPKDPIYYEPVEFASHLKPSHPAPSESSDDVTTTFGGVRFIIDSEGFLRLPRAGTSGSNPPASTEDTQAATLEIPPGNMRGGNRGNLDHATGRKKRRWGSYYGEREQESMQSIHGRARSPHLSATEQLDAPCYLHSYIDPKDGREKSSHLLRNCRHFLEIRQFCDDLRNEALSRAHIMEKKTRSYSYRAEPYIPEPYEPMEKDEYVPAEVFPEPRGQVSMIHKTSFSKREIKKFSREVKYAEVAMVDTPEFIDWSEQSISFDRTDHPKAVPRPGHAALVLEAQIGGYNMSKVFMDGGSGLNLLFANTMKAMGLTVDMLRESDTGFHGIIPTRPAYSLGKTTLDVVFGTPTNFRREKIEFEVVDGSLSITPSSAPAFAKFMAVPHYAYLKLKMPGNNGTPITTGA